MIASVEQQQSIRMDCILVDSRGAVLEVQRQRVALVSSGASACAVIPESVFLGLVHALRHQRPDKRRFQLADVMTFFVPAPLHHVAASAGAAASASAGAAAGAAASAKMQTLPPIPCDVVVPTTLPIFHGINRIWLIFREEVLVLAATPTNKKPPLAVSILKNGATKSNNINKRVRISQELPRYKELRKPRKTIKIH